MRRSGYKYRCTQCGSTFVTNPRTDFLGRKWSHCHSCGANFTVD